MFVSANQFDNEPARVTAVGCQGFVGKPVVESELLQSLQSALGLEWLHDPAPGPAPAPTPVRLAPPGVTSAPPDHIFNSAEPLPESLREALYALARSGQATALRERLREAQTAWPEHTAALTRLQASADRLDFEALALLLREPETDLDEPA